jgi:outer membrane biogenesis lipoprotein LolB
MNLKYKYLTVALFLLLVLSCKSTKGLSEGKAVDILATKNIIKNHYDNKRDFETLYIRASARYKDNKQTHSFSAEIKMKKDEIILVSVRFLGITMAKALITPDEVKYYEKSGNTYFEGDYTTLSQWLGTDLDFSVVQNMLIGKAMADLRKETYANTIEDKMYKLHRSKGNTHTAFYFEANNFLIKKQQIEQPALARTLEVNYPAHKEYTSMVLPIKVNIFAFQPSEKNTITLDYNNVSFNETLSFPYKVPENYTRIEIQ